MKKILLLFVLCMGVCGLTYAQEPVTPVQPEEEDEEVDVLVPMDSIAEAIVFVTDSLPTAEYMTIYLLGEGIIDSTQVPEAFVINMAYYQAVQQLTKNPKVTQQ